MGIFDAFIQAVNKEYDRRIRRSSEIIEYGMKHGHGHGHDDHGHGHGHDHDHAQAPTPATDDPTRTEEDEDDGATVISNVPRGARVAGSTRPAPRKQHDDTAV